MKLINGRGQLGESLALKVKDNRNIFIYHTWNILDKSKEVQEREFRKFRDFADQHKDNLLVFISTYSEHNDHYVRSKQNAEAYLLTNCPEGYVIKLPTLIGKGICERFRSDGAQPYGKMELMTIEEAAKSVIEICDKIPQVNRIFRVKGEIVCAKLAYNLIKFGRDGKC